MRGLRTGFTLIELVVVTIIILILVGAAFSVSGFTRSADHELRFKARKVAGNVESAKQQVGITGALVRIVYDFEEQRMYMLAGRKLEEDESIEDFDEEELLEPAGSMTFGRPGEPEKSKVWLDSVQTYDGKVHNNDPLIIDLHPRGSAIGHVVNLLSANGEHCSIELNPVTGIAYVTYSEDGFKEVAEPEKDDSF